MTFILFRATSMVVIGAFIHQLRRGLVWYRGLPDAIGNHW